MSQLDEKQSEVDSSDFSSMKVAELRDLLKEKICLLKDEKPS